MPGMKPAYTLNFINRLHEITDEEAIALYGHPLRLDLGGAFYPLDGDGGRNLLLLAERKLQNTTPSWEESLRALSEAAKSVAETPEFA